MSEDTVSSGTRPDPEPSQIDDTLISSTLAMSPEERLRHNDRMIRTAEILRRGVDATASRRR